MRKSGGGVARRGKGSGTEGANSSTGTRGGKVEEVRSIVVHLNESTNSYGTEVEEKIAQLANRQNREVQERQSLSLELEGVRMATVGSTTMCEVLVHELANLRLSV